MKLVSWQMAFISLGLFLAAFPAPYSALTRGWHQDPSMSPLSLVFFALLTAMCGGGFLWFRHRLRARTS